MNLKTFNESFRKYYTEDIDDAIKESFETDLRTALIDKAERLGRSGTMNLKRYEIEFQDTIETLVPEKSWWEVTDCDIFNNLFNTHDIMGTIDCIIDSLKPEYKDIVESVDKDDEYYVHTTTPQYYKIDKTDYWRFIGDNFRFDTSDPVETL